MAGGKRRTQAGVQERGEATRRKLIEAGLRRFGRDGFDATTTRTLAAEAGVNLAAIPYHFGSKEALYAAVAEHIAAQITRRLGGLLDRADTLRIDGQESREEAAELIVDILAAMGRTMLSDEAAVWAPIVLREQMAPSAAFDRLYHGAMRHVIGTVAALLDHCLGGGRPPRELSARAVALLGQVAIFRIAHAAVLRQLDVERVDEDMADWIVGLVREQTRAVLRAAMAGDLHALPTGIGERDE